MAEKLIKAYLIAHGINFPFIHNLEKLIELGAQHDPDFINIKLLGQELTPYAVELRYDDEFWPEAATAGQALDAALAIKKFVIDRIPPEMKSEGERVQIKKS
ncbi:MAG: HEPN domain-containing protein [Chloroflexota bacterium]|nr:HEPN domain-containing protein [Chloroflexota bacterium]